MDILQTITRALLGFNSGVQPLVWPTPRLNKCGYGLTGQFIPDLSVNDGTGWVVSQAINQVFRYGPTGTLIYTISIADINASVANMVGVFPDYATSRLYIYATDAAGTTAWLAYTTMAAKAMTVRASHTPTVNNSRFPFFEKVGADFGIWTGVSAAGGAMNTATITEATGATSAATPFRLGGCDIALPSFNFTVNPLYLTADKTVAMTMFCAYAAYPWVLHLARGGGQRNLSMSATNFGSATHTIGGGLTMGVVVNGDQVCLMLRPDASGAGSPMLLREFLRADFDAFLQRCCDFAGLPR